MRTAKGLCPAFLFSPLSGVAVCPFFSVLGLRDGPLPESPPFTEALRGDKQHKEGERKKRCRNRRENTNLLCGCILKRLPRLRSSTGTTTAVVGRSSLEKAILFYAGYLAADNCRDYIPNVIVSTVKGSLDSLENRMANLLFKMAVELSMMLHVTAAANAIDETSLTRLRGLCVEEVKRLLGAIRMEDAVRFQKGGASV